jgi:hypothetical protein
VKGIQKLYSAEKSTSSSSSSLSLSTQKEMTAYDVNLIKRDVQIRGMGIQDDRGFRMETLDRESQITF